MFKKFLATILAVAMVAAMWIIPASAADVVLDVDYGDKAWKGESAVVSDTLPIPKEYSGNFALELYVKINDFATPSVIAGAFPDGGATPYAIWVNGGNLYFSAGDTNGNNHVVMGSAYTDNWAGKWIHIIGAKNGTTNTLYVSPEGSSDYATASVSRTHAIVWSDATAFKVNSASTLFDGAGDFSLGTIRMYNDDVSANRAAMKAECAARLDAAHATEAPTEAPATPGKDEVSLIIVSKPSQLFYEIGDTFAADGLEVAIKVDGVTTPVALEDCTIEGFDSETAGKKVIKVSYETEDVLYSNKFTVKVQPESVFGVTALALVSKPEKLFYAYNEAFDATGLKVMAKYSDGTTAIIDSGLEISYNAKESGLQRVIVTYEGHTTGFTVSVAEKIPAPMQDAKFLTVTTPKANYTNSIVLPESFTIEVKGSGAAGYLIWGGRYQIQIQANGAVQAWNFYKSALAMTSSKTYDLNDEIHVVLVGEGNTLSMYVNGELSKTSQGDDLVVSGEFNITNKCIFGDQSADGVEVNFYNQAATAEDVAGLYVAR